MTVTPSSSALPLSLATAMLVAMLSLSSLSGCMEPIAPDQQGCRSNRECPIDHVCRSGECEARPGCLTNLDCAGGQVCSPLTRQCVPSGNPIDEEEEEEEDEEDEEDPKSCRLGNRYCDEGNAFVCNDGIEYEELDCEDMGCSNGHCVVCEPSKKSCDLDRNMLMTCSGDGTVLVETSCSNGVCNPDTNTCVFYTCDEGDTVCSGTTVRQCAPDRMSYEDAADCADDGLFCNRGRCVDECELAVLENSYIGCEYWPVVLANVVDQRFHDEYAVVVSNPHESRSADVQVFRADSATALRSVTVAPGAVETIKLPWNAMSARSGRSTQTQRGTIAYRLVSSLPVTAYQFNPLATAKGGTYSHTNDASLLLPTHVYAPPGRGSTYFVLGMAHQQRYIRPDFGSSTTNDWGALVAVVATEDNTEVTVRARGAIAAGAGVPSLNPGGTAVFTLNRHEVMQLASRAHGSYDSAFIGSVLTIPIIDAYEHLYQREYRQSDLTGSIITADKPIAVYSGADCYYMPFDKQACDHLEEQLFPFENLGSTYVASRTAQPPAEPGRPLQDPGDIWRIVAALDGTELTFEPQVRPNVTLNAGEWIQIQTNQDFIVTSQSRNHPIGVAQFMVGQEATNSAMGDPSMILAVPVTQYRSNYAFTTPTTIAKNYINVVRPKGTSVVLNGNPVTTGWTQLGDVEIARIEIPGGNHTLEASEKVGVTVYGYDAYVSYGYPAGMDLTRNVDVVLP